MKRLYDKSFAEFYEKQFPELVADCQKRAGAKQLIAFLDSQLPLEPETCCFARTYTFPHQGGASTFARLLAVYLGGVLGVPTLLRMDEKAQMNETAWRLGDMLEKIGLNSRIVEKYSNCICLSTHLTDPPARPIFHIADIHPFGTSSGPKFSLLSVAKTAGEATRSCKKKGQAHSKARQVTGRKKASNSSSPACWLWPVPGKPDRVLFVAETRNDKFAVFYVDKTRSAKDGRKKKRFPSLPETYVRSAMQIELDEFAEKWDLRKCSVSTWDRIQETLNLGAKKK